MEYSTVIEAVNKANCALDLERKILGVRFLFTEDEFKASEATRLGKRIPYCRMVFRAARGNEMKVDVSNFGCFAAARILGLVEMDDWYTSGHYYGTSGLYVDYPTAKEVTDHMSMCGHKIHGIELRPLEKFTVEPHIVIVVANPFNIQRLVQGHAYQNGTISDFKFIGNQAICSEATARPYQANNINISMLCSGARKNGGKPHELALGIPLTKFVSMIDGLCETITPVERNPRKRRILEKLSAAGIKDVSVVLDMNYGIAMAEYDFAHFVPEENLRGPDESK